MGENIKTIADALEGTELKNGWTVVERINPDEDSTGGNFSIPYKVEKNGEVAFLKALNFKAFFDIQSQGAKDVRVVDVMQEFLETFQFERDLTQKCRNQGLGNVIRLLDEGEHEISGVPYGRVPYLIILL